MLTYETDLVTEALRRYSPAIVALTTETKDTVDVMPILNFMARDAVTWKAIHVLDRLEVCHWFVQNVTDPIYASIVSDVRSQLAIVDSQGPDATLSAMCLKHRIIAIAVGRERERRAVIAAAETEYRDLVSQLMEDGMPEPEASLEARRTLDEAEDKDEDEGLPPVRDIIIIKGYPYQIAEIFALDRLGVSLNAIVFVNSPARFGRRDDALIDSKDGRVAAKKRPDLRKPDNKKGKGAKDEVDRLEPLSTQISKELARLDAFDVTPLRDILVWAYEVPCVEGPMLDDGLKSFTLKESETMSSEKVCQSIFAIIEKTFRYREWASCKQYVRVPKLKVRDPPEPVTVVAPAVPVVTVTPSKVTKKQKQKPEPEPQREEVAPVVSVPDISDTVAELPTSLDVVDALLRSAGDSVNAAAELCVFGSVAQASMMTPLGSQACPEKPPQNSIYSVESEAATFMDNLLHALSGGDVAFAQKPSNEWRLLTSLVSASGAVEDDDQIAQNSFLRLSRRRSLANGSAVGLNVKTVARATREKVLGVTLGRDASTSSRTESFGSALESICAGFGEKTPSATNRLVELLSEAQLSEKVMADAFRSDAEGFDKVSIVTQLGSKIVGKRSLNPSNTNRFRHSWYVLQGRLPFPIWSALEDTYQSEHAHYFPPLNDDDEPEDTEEEEEEEDTFDEDGNLLPKKVRTYPIVFRNESSESHALVKRRSVYESLKAFLKPTIAEATLAYNHGATTICDEHTTMHPDDGNCISVHSLRANTDQRLCTVHDCSGFSSFGFNAILNQSKQRGGKQGNRLRTISNGVRAFFTTICGLRVSIETFITDPLPNTETVKAEPIVEAAPPPAPTSTASPSAPKRANTPRSKQSNAATVPAAAVVSEETSSPSPAFVAPTTVVAEAPYSVFTLILSETNHLRLTSSETIFTLARPVCFKVTVAGTDGLTDVEDAANRVAIDSDGGGSIMLIGKTCRFKIFTSGDIATFYHGQWLLTAVGTGNRILRNSRGVFPVAPCLMATTIINSETNITRDDGVVIRASPNVVISAPGGVGLEKGVDGHLSNFSVLGVDIVFDVNTFKINFNQGSTLIRTHTGQVCVGFPHNCTRLSFDFSSGRMYVTPSSGSHTYTIDCIFGGLRVHDNRDAFHVTPLGRCRKVARTVEEAPLPTDLTTRHTVDVFVETPEVVNPLFEAYAASSGRGISTSLHVQTLLPSLPGVTAFLHSADFSRAQELPKSIYVEEKSRFLNKNLSEFKQISSSSGQHGRRMGISLFVQSKDGSGWALASDTTVAACIETIRQTKPTLSHITQRKDGGAVITDTICCTDEAPGGVSSCEVQTFCETSQDSPLFWKTTDPSSLLQSIVHSIPRVLLTQFDQSLGASVPITEIAFNAATRAHSNAWPEPLPSLHANHKALRTQEPRYWISRHAHLSPLRAFDATALQRDTLKHDQSPTSNVTPRRPPGQSPSRQRVVTTQASVPPPAIKLPSVQHQQDTSRRLPKRVLVATPSELSGGPVMERFRYAARVQLTNVSTYVGRFRVTCESKWVALDYVRAPLAAGMTTAIDVEINGQQKVGDLQSTIVVAFEGGCFEIPLHFECYPASSKVIVPPSQGCLRIVGPL